MKIIDAHIHFSNIRSFHDVSKQSNVDYSLKGFENEFKDIIAIGMGLTEGKDKFPNKYSSNPMKLDLDRNPKNLFCSLGINPKQPIDKKELESQIKDNVVGLKVYAGYYHYHIHDDIYNPVYELALTYDIPVTIHTGDTYSEQGRLKFAHPLEVDELAFKYPNLKIIIAHFGDPWIMDAAEVAAKNKNVFIDLSGLIIGDQADVDRFDIDEFTFRLRQGMVFLDDYKKLLFGSDWPLVKLQPYIEFIKKLIPIEHIEDVFYNNAKRVFKL